MVNNSKSANAATNVKPAGKLEGTGLAGANGGQAKSANKMNILANKLIKALNQYMDAPAVAASPIANKKNAANVSNSISINTSAVTSTISAPPIANKKNGVNVSNSISTNTPSLNKPLIKKNNQNKPANAINTFEQTINNSKENNPKKNKNSTKTLATRKSRVGLMKTQTFKGGRRTRYNRHKSVRNRK
jgi:hypothetical protein